MRRVAAFVLVSLLLASGCGGDGKDDKKDSADRVGDTTTSSTTSTTASDGATTTTSAPASSAPNATGTGQNATAPADAKPAGSSGGSSSTASPDTPMPAAPGTYTYNRTGKASATGFGEQSLDGPVTLKVDPAVNGEQRSVESSSEGESEQILRQLSEGAYFTLLRQSTTGFNKEFRPNPPVLALPTTPTVGRTWSWTVTSTDGKTTLNASFKVERKETIAVGSEQVPTLVVSVVLKGSGDITLTTNQTNWIAASKGLSVRVDKKTDGVIGGVSFHSESSQIMQSTRPS